MVTSNGFLVDSKIASQISDSGLTHITLSLDGLRAEVHACGLLVNIGNIREQSIGEIWLSAKAQDRRREMGLCSRNYNNKVNWFLNNEAVNYEN